MDRYVIREPRFAYPQGQPPFLPDIIGNNNIEEYGGEHSRIQFNGIGHPGYINYIDANTSFQLPPQLNINQMPQRSGQPMQGMYLPAYSGTTNYVPTEAIYQEQITPNAFGQYMNRNLAGPNRNTVRTFNPQVLSTEIHNVPRPNLLDKQSPKPRKNEENNNNKSIVINTPASLPGPSQKDTPKPATKYDDSKKEKTITRADKMKVLYKIGPRTFSGPVEKVLKWHKALQPMGVFVLYEIVAKCVSVRPGENSTKQILVRDDGGPAMQLVYYEIDYLLPELQLPTMIRVVGKMIPCSSRLHAYSVRAATADDVASLSRRTAVSVHHVEKLCKEFSN